MTLDKSVPTTSTPLTSSAGDSHAKTSQSQASNEALTEPAVVSGQSMRGSFARLDPDTLLWRTSQRSLMGGWVAFLEAWPRAGMMRSGTVYQQRPSAPRISAIGCLWWPTPTTKPHRPCEGNVRLLRAKIKAGEITSGEARAMLGGQDPFLAQGIVKADSNSICEPSMPGRLNPNWIDWLMGFPVGWTDLDASETP